MGKFYGSDSDADSLMPLPGIPTLGQKTTVVKIESSPSAKSEDPASSSASNGTPLKKSG
ncbi:UNVERIFIED_CONTAM: hypothetical protein Sradi_4108100 [Sesamum radiatum]|uniref:Uncharacterized protein n=1 Tax=Sesamum radiatum TaxID=300843 RepID=A0AAW2P181_SESRA